jgi:hypothetical protein
LAFTSTIGFTADCAGWARAGVAGFTAAGAGTAACVVTLRLATRVVATDFAGTDRATVRVVRFTVLGAVVEAVFASVAGAAVSLAGAVALLSGVVAGVSVVGGGWSAVLAGGGSVGTGCVC